MTAALYLSHPEVRVEPAVPVPEWHLAPAGVARLDAVVRRPWLRAVERVVASEEVKAREAAAIVAEALGLVAETAPGLHENDRSATGYLPPEQFEAVADAFFARPDEAVQGWEPARAAQRRIVSAVRAVLARDSRATLFVGHGGVGTLLHCHVAGLPIDRRYDQARSGGMPGGGNVHAFAADLSAARFGWRAMEEL